MTPEIETTSETSTPAGTTVEAAGTPTTPGFEIVAAIVGLIACSFLIKRKNK
jgi:PGF-CTERM protein